MAKHPRSYPPEFRQKIIELVRSGRNGNDVAHEFSISRQTLSNWLKQDDLDSGRRSDGLTSAESEEMTRLRKRVRQLEIERDILKKAAAKSTGQRNTKPMIFNGGVANGSNGATRSVDARESRTLEALEAR